MTKPFENSGDPDQTPRSAASELGLHCLPVTLLGVSRLQLVKEVSNIWTMPSEKVLSNMCKMRRFISSCECAKYHPGLCPLFIHSLVSNDSVCGQRKP